MAQAAACHCRRRLPRDRRDERRVLQHERRLGWGAAAPVAAAHCARKRARAVASIRMAVRLGAGVIAGPTSNVRIVTASGGGAAQAASARAAAPAAQAPRAATACTGARALAGVAGTAVAGGAGGGGGCGGGSHGVYIVSAGVDATACGVGARVGRGSTRRAFLDAAGGRLLARYVGHRGHER